jgi:hypothetical protein
LTDETIDLAGRKFVVPPLSARRIMAFVPRLAAMGTINTSKMSQDELEGLYELVLIGAQQGMPTLTKDDLLDMPITLANAIDAIMVIAKQAGMDLKPVPPDAAAPNTEISTSPSSKPNGMTQSPTS